MKNKTLFVIKKEIIIAFLMLALASIMLASMLIYFQITAKHAIEINEKDKIIKQKDEMINLKDSLYLKCNGDLKRIDDDPIYQFYKRNDLLYNEGK